MHAISGLCDRLTTLAHIGGAEVLSKRCNQPLAVDTEKVES